LRGSARALHRAPVVRAAVLALAGTLLAACSVRSPATEVKDALSRLSRLEVPDTGGARLELDRVRFADVTVSMDGPRALVIAVVEAEGRARTDVGAPSITYVGREAFVMERCAKAGWCPVGTPLPALRGVVSALAEAPRAPGVRVTAWQIRIERGVASAGEDYEGPGGLPARVLHEVALLDGEWRLAPGR